MEKQQRYSPHGRRSIGHCWFDAAVPIHFKRQCMWNTCVHSPQTAQVQPEMGRLGEGYSALVFFFFRVSANGRTRTYLVDSRRQAFYKLGSTLRMARGRYHTHPLRHLRHRRLRRDFLCSNAIGRWHASALRAPSWIVIM